MEVITYPAKANIKMKNAFIMLAAASGLSIATIIKWPKLLVITKKMTTIRNAQTPLLWV